MHHNVGYIFVMPTPQEIRERTEYNQEQRRVRLSRLAPARYAPPKVPWWRRKQRPKKYDGYWSTHTK